VLAIARGEYKPKSHEPKVWFTSMKSLETMSNYGFVELKRERHSVRPVAKATELRIIAH
jgi:predicted transcriptional regulator